jgi:hypothetical protein
LSRSMEYSCCARFMKISTSTLSWQGDGGAQQAVERRKLLQSSNMIHMVPLALLGDDL